MRTFTPTTPERDLAYDDSHVKKRCLCGVFRIHTGVVLLLLFQLVAHCYSLGIGIWAWVLAARCSSPAKHSETYKLDCLNYDSTSVKQAVIFVITVSITFIFTFCGLIFAKNRQVSKYRLWTVLALMIFGYTGSRVFMAILYGYKNWQAWVDSGLLMINVYIQYVFWQYRTTIKYEARQINSKGGIA